MVQSMKRYVGNVGNTTLTVLKGLRVTLINLFRTPITIQYPEVDIRQKDLKAFGYKGPLGPLPDRFRGFLRVNPEICIACDLCMKACPIDCIRIESTKIDKTTIQGKDGKAVNKVKHPVRFDIHLGKCMYCGLCVEPCPTGAISFSKEFEGATSTLNTLVVHFAEPKGLPVREATIL